MIKAVLFDMDGVLLDALEGSAKAYQEAIVEAGYPKPTIQQIYDVFHLTARNTVKALVKGVSEKEVDRILELEKHGLTVTELKIPENYIETLEKLSKSYSLCVVSASGKARAEHLLKIAGSLGFFDMIVAIEDYTRPKPHPEPLLTALGKMNLKPEEAIYVGDREADIEAAEAAGMRCIGYLGFAKHELPSAEITTRKFEELPSIIKKWER